MTESPEKFYSRGAEKFAEDQALEKMPQEYFDLLDNFVELVNGEKVLDAGCGPGRDTEYFIENGLEAVGIDLAEKMIEYARKNKKGEFHLMDIQDLIFEDEEFDGVWCNQVIQFFSPGEMENAISELKRVLNPGGKLYISFKIGEGEFIREKYGSEVKHHLISEEKAKQMLKSKGFKILDKNKSEVKNLTVLGIFCQKEQ